MDTHQFKEKEKTIIFFSNSQCSVLWKRRIYLFIIASISSTEINIIGFDSILAFPSHFKPCLETMNQDMRWISRKKYEDSKTNPFIREWRVYFKHRVEFYSTCNTHSNRITIQIHVCYGLYTVQLYTLWCIMSGHGHTEHIIIINIRNCCAF